MIPRKALFFIILFSVLSISLNAQLVVFYTTQKVEYRIPYNKAGGEIYFEGNQLLREMAKEVLREPWQVRLLISCELGMTIQKKGEEDQLTIALKHPIVSGDTLFRRFRVSSELLPSMIRMKLRWANRADTSGFTEQTLTGKPIPLADSLLCSMNIAPFDPEVDTLLVREIEFYYDSLKVLKFMERIELIHDYYASVALLDSLQKFTADLRPGDATLMPVNYLKVEELNRVLARIDARDFPGRLLENAHDPLGLMQKYQQTYKHSRTLTYNLIDEMHKTGAISWNRDVNLLAGYFVSRVFSYVRRSYLMDQQQGRIYGDCLDHFFDQVTFPPEENVAGALLVKMYPDAGQDTIARYISQTIYSAYKVMALQLMEQNLYAEAFTLMENGRQFIAANPAMKGYAADDHLQSRAAEGIFHSYIGIASTCIRGHKYSMADLYLSKADEYASAHADYIRSDSIYRTVFSELFFLRNTDCDQLLNEKKYAEALDCYDQFEQAYSVRDLALVSKQLNEKKLVAKSGLGNLSAMLSEAALKRKESDTALFYYQQATAFRQDVVVSEPVDARLDSLAPLMGGIQYKQIVAEGATALEKRQYTLAVNRLTEAKVLADMYKIDRGHEFDSLWRQSMKFYLIVQLSAAQKKIWANQFDSAEVALNRTETAGFGLGLQNDPDFSAALSNYKIKVREQLCRNIQDSVDIRVIRADRSIALLNFVNAQASLREALDFIKSMPECGITDEPLMDTLNKYSLAVVYQQQMMDARSHVASGNYSEAVRELDNHQQAFYKNKFSRFGLSPEGVYDFIKDRENPYLTEKALVFYIENENYPEALRFLLLAQTQGLPAKSCAGSQEKLAIFFAGEDFRKNRPGQPVIITEAYVPDSDWFTVFRGSYARETSRLLKETQSGSIPVIPR